MISDKDAYELARRRVLRRLGERKVSAMSDEMARRYRSELTAEIEKIKGVYGSAATMEMPAAATAAAPEVVEEITVKEEIIAESAGGAIEAAMAAIEADVPIIAKMPTVPRGLKPPIIDGLDFIDTFHFTIFKGYAGIGKTASVLSWGVSHGYDVYSFVCSEDMNTPDLVGSFIIKGGDVVFNESAITAAVRNSNRKKTLLILDEINLLRPSVLKSLNDLLDFRKELNTVIGKFYGKDLKIVGLMNMESESAGSELDVSVQSRAFVVEVDVDATVKKLVATKVVSSAIGEVMKKTNFAFGLREAAQLNTLVAAGVPQAVSMLLVKYADLEQRRQIEQAFAAVIGASYNTAVKSVAGAAYAGKAQ